MKTLFLIIWYKEKICMYMYNKKIFQYSNKSSVIQFDIKRFQNFNTYYTIIFELCHSALR